jgi:hypothetical protein
MSKLHAPTQSEVHVSAKHLTFRSIIGDHPELLLQVNLFLPQASETLSRFCFSSALQ